MKCGVVLLALGLASVADAFFFPFFGKGKGNSGHKYPGASKVPSHYGPPRPRPPIRPTLTYGPPRPVTTYGPPNVRPKPPSTSYGPPSKGPGSGSGGGFPGGNGGGHGGGNGNGGYPGGTGGGHGGGQGNGGYPGSNGGGQGGGKGNGGYPGGTGGGHGGGKGNGGYPGGTGGGQGGGKGNGGYPGGTGGGHGGGKGNGGYPGGTGGGHGSGNGGYPGGTGGGHGGGKGNGGYPGGTGTGGGHEGGKGNGEYPGGTGGGQGGGKGNGGYPGGTGGGQGGGKGNGGYPGGTGGGHGGGKGNGGYPGGTGGGQGGGKGNGGYPGGTGGGQGGGKGNGGYPGGTGGGHGGGKGNGGYPGGTGGGQGGGKGNGGYPGGTGGGHGGGKGNGGYPGGTGGGNGGGKGNGGYPSGTGGGHSGGKGEGGYPGGTGGGNSGGKGSGGYPGGTGGGKGSTGYPGGSSGSGVGGSLNHHTHFHSHYHSTTAGYQPEPRATLTGGLPSLTAALPGPGVLYTTVTRPAPSGTLSPQRPTHSATIVHTRPPPTIVGYQYLPPQGQASDKVATYVPPEFGVRTDRGLISPRDAGAATRPQLADLGSNLLGGGGEVSGLAGPGVQQQGPQTPLLEVASSDRLVVQQPPADQQQQQQAAGQQGMAERLRRLGLIRFLSLVERAGLEKLLESRGGVTLFAFTDEAWSLLPYSLRRQLSADPERLRQLLLHHVAPLAVPPTAFNDNMVLKSASPTGATLRVNIYQMSRYSERVVTINGAQVIESDASAASGGVVHVLDRALVAEATLDALQYLTTQQCADLDFSGVSNMLTKLGVSQLLSQQSPLTLFLPISAAFSDPEGLAEDFSNSTKVMQNSLLYHLVPGAFYSAGLRDGQWLETLLDGQELELQVVTDGYTRRISTVSKQAQVIRADIPISNGVIHIIDFVLRPERNLQRCDVHR